VGPANAYCASLKVESRCEREVEFTPSGGSIVMTESGSGLCNSRPSSPPLEAVEDRILRAGGGFVHFLDIDYNNEVNLCMNRRVNLV